jgi:thiamine pyrophosphate-dependent acetolactate synthase large subunit-like protein
MDITHGLLNKHELGKISKEQRSGNWGVWQTSLHKPDFSEYARLCGAYGVRVTERGQLDDALAQALAQDGPSLVEIESDPELV